MGWEEIITHSMPISIDNLSFIYYYSYLLFLAMIFVILYGEFVVILQLLRGNIHHLFTFLRSININKIKLLD
jgi:hypothetical protein